MEGTFIRIFIWWEMHPKIVSHFRFYPKHQKQIKRRQIYLLFVGESSRYDHWSINGYGGNTSPLLTKEKNLISYKKVCVQGRQDEIFSSYAFDGSSPCDFKRHYSEKSAISLLNEAGFHTYWISEQVEVSM